MIILDDDNSDADTENNVDDNTLNGKKYLY